MRALARVHRCADRQLGLITREELRGRGLTDSQVKHLVAVGALIRVHRGIYRIPGSPQSLEQRALAACLACGAGAVTSGRTASDLWRLVERPSGLIEVTLTDGRYATHNGVIVHRTLHLARHEGTWLGKVPITTVKRTIKDLPRELKEEAFDTAIRHRRITPHAFVDEPGYLGELAKDRLGLGVPHEKIERKAIEVLRKYRLPAALRQHPVNVAGRNYNIDLAYPDKKIAIELKGEAPHWGRDRFQYDIDRSNALKLDGWDEFTFTWMQVTKRQADVAAIVTRALRQA
jgi:very-short-patch-repair endonuclease